MLTIGKMRRAVTSDSFTASAAPSAPDFQFQSTATGSTNRILPVRTGANYVLPILGQANGKKGRSAVLNAFEAAVELFVGVLHRGEPNHIVLLMQPCHGFVPSVAPSVRSGSLHTTTAAAIKLGQAKAPNPGGSSLRIRYSFEDWLFLTPLGTDSILYCSHLKVNKVLRT